MRDGSLALLREPQRLPIAEDSRTVKKIGATYQHDYRRSYAYARTE
jgi:hypothetical protein